MVSSSDLRESNSSIFFHFFLENLQLLSSQHTTSSSAVFQTSRYSSLPSNPQLLFPWPKHLAEQMEKIYRISGKQ